MPQLKPEHRLVEIPDVRDTMEAREHADAAAHAFDPTAYVVNVWKKSRNPEPSRSINCNALICIPPKAIDRLERHPTTPVAAAEVLPPPLPAEPPADAPLPSDEPATDDGETRPRDGETNESG